MSTGKHLLSAGMIVLVIGLSSLLSGCSEPPTPPLRMASSPWPGYEPYYLARDIGYLNENLVQLYELPSSDITMESFRNGSTDLATLTLDETLELLQDGTRLRIVQVLDISHGADAVLASPGITHLQQIKGKRISIVNIPLGLYMLNRLLQKAGLERSDVQVFPMSESKQVNFYRQGKADIIITFEPVKTKLQELGMHIIFDSSMIPGEIIDLLVAHEEVYTKRRDDICRLVQQWDKTLEYMRRNKESAAVRISKRLGLDKGDYDKIMSGLVLASNQLNRKMLGGDKPEIIQPAQILSGIMYREQQLTRPVSIVDAIDPEFSSCYL